MSKTFSFASILALAAAPALAQVPEAMDPAAIPNYTRVSPALAAAGQPSLEALKQLKQSGFKTVINLRTASESGVIKEEQELVEAQGLRYLAVPITYDSFSAADVKAVASVLDDADAGPVLLHCTASNRVGGVLAVIAAQKGKPLEDAIAEGKAAGLRSEPMIAAVKRVLGEKH